MKEILVASDRKRVDIGKYFRAVIGWDKSGATEQEWMALTPKMLEEYERVLLGARERLLAMIEREEALVRRAHEASAELAAIRAKHAVGERKLALWMNVAIWALYVILGGVLIITGHVATGLIIFGFVVSGLIVVFCALRKRVSHEK